MENENIQTADTAVTGNEADMQQSAGDAAAENTATIQSSEAAANAGTPDAEKTAAATPMIKNPLPLPTPHTNRKEVDYDYEVPEDQMHFDIEKPSRNYYDIQ